jgi:prepilin-type N-terminal cleavage/methylation domain-containing protein
MRAIAKWEEVPIFDSEEAEAGFWAENKPDLRLMEGAVAAATEAAGLGHHHAAHRRADAGAHQAHGSIPLPQLPEHDQTVAQRTDGTRIPRTMREECRMKNEEGRRKQAAIGDQRPVTRGKWQVASGRSLRTPHSALRTSRAFTLVELLVVLAVIAALAALTFPAIQGAKRSMIRARAKAELMGLQVAIERYKDKLGHYPPDNKVVGAPDPYALNQLYYELLGTTNSDGVFHTLDDSAQISANPTTLANAFAGPVTGFMNCARPHSGDEIPSGIAFLKGLRATQYLGITNTSSSTVVYVLGAGMEGPLPYPVKFSPWRYNVSNPRYNTKSFDLWIDLIVGDKTNRVCNWSDKPITVGAPYQ